MARDGGPNHNPNPNLTATTTSRHDPNGAAMMNTTATAMIGSGRSTTGALTNESSPYRHSSRNESDGSYHGSNANANGGYNFNRIDGIATTTSTYGSSSSTYHSDGSSTKNRGNPTLSGNTYSQYGGGDGSSYSSPGQYGNSTSKKKNDSHITSGKQGSYPNLSSNLDSGAYNQGYSSYSSSNYDNLAATTTSDRLGQGNPSSDGSHYRSFLNGHGSSPLQEVVERKKHPPPHHHHHHPTAAVHNSAAEMRNSADSMQIGLQIDMDADCSLP